MSKSSKPRKVYARNREADLNLKSIRNMQLFAKRLTVVCSQSDPKHVLLCKDGIPIQTTQSIAKMFDHIKFNWSFMFGVLCRDQNEKLYIKYVELNTLNQELLADNLSAYFTDCLKELFLQVNSQHRLTTFYAATPANQNIDEYAVIKCLWNFKVPDIMSTQYEVDHKNGAPSTLYCEGSWQDLASNISWQEFSSYKPKNIIITK